MGIALRILSEKTGEPTFEEEGLRVATVALHITAEQFIDGFSGEQGFIPMIPHKFGNQ